MQVNSTVWLGALLAASLPVMVFAQEQPTSSPAPVTKAQAKAARKAQSKEAREVRNAELKKLEQNGYGPQATQQDYPQNLIRAEHKAANPDAASSPPSR
ncbi:hypothetical protein E2553_41650 [Paraburkholderia dipogonis]|uniref:DUF4148 domain-containing protein n=1 Tax=Paraburkholderia dipogonis TaxID=1211383 RepID=A0A4Y8MKC6_9BURK|nr:hypothetical protein [Paraburkholderia dipogonis]TFE37868.1 hypothetical protein E2553_41650 [Paraburkholderia dipogonis]